MVKSLVDITITDEIPFSDPITDGLSIQEASYHALQKDIKADIC